jgi:hypothetical protein
MAVAGALAGIALGASACSSSSSSATTTTTSPSGSSTPTSSSASGSSTTSTTSASSGGASLSQLESKLSSGQVATFAATYKLTGTEAGKSVNGTLTVAHSGTSSLFGVVTAQGAFEEIVTGTTSVICAKQAAAWECFGGASAASLGASVAAFSDLYSSKAALALLKSDSALASDVTESSSTVAGQPVSCYTFHAKTDNGLYTFCVTASGVMAEWYGSDTTGNWKLLVSSYSSSVPSNEFTPPATPTTIPTGT